MILHNALEKTFQHVNSITHEGKVILVATYEDGSLWYTIKQDGFEDSYLQADPQNRRGWEKWRPLPLPGSQQSNGVVIREEEPDHSVLHKEREELTVKYPEGTEVQLMTSRYRLGYCRAAVAPVKLISRLGHLYVFRQAAETSSLLVDRFVLDGMTNELKRKLEVRFKRSGQKYKALEGKPGQSAKVDSLDFRDADNRPFYEPTKELSLIKNLHQGWFDVVLIPTQNHDIHRWHFFFYESFSQQIEVISIKSSSEGLFDFRDTHQEKGIVRKKIQLKNWKGQALKVINGPGATKYDIQKERKTEQGTQLLREATRIMLTIPTDKGTAAISFALSSHGMLSQISRTFDRRDLRSSKQEILLPLNTLDKIEAFGGLAGGNILALTNEKKAGNDNNFFEIVIDEADFPDHLNTGDLIKISGTPSADGTYTEENTAKTDLGDSSYEFNITPDENFESLGRWSVMESDKTKTFTDGAISYIDKTDRGNITLFANGIDMKEGDTIKIEGNQDHNGIYEVITAEPTCITLKGKIQMGKVVNVQQEMAKRRGIQFDSDDAHIEIPNWKISAADGGTGFQQTISAWVYIPEGKTTRRTLFSHSYNSLHLEYKDGKITFLLRHGESAAWSIDLGPIKKGVWTHCTVVLLSPANQYQAEEPKLLIETFRDGNKVERAIRSVSKSYLHKANSFFIGGLPRHKSKIFYKGALEVNSLADGPVKMAGLQVWDKVLNPQEIKNTMYRTLTGKETGLLAYWRLGGIVPGKIPEVIDFSVHQQHGSVYGNAFVAGVSLDRHLKTKNKKGNPIPANSYQNDHLISVTLGATYLETFDFRVDKGDKIPSPNLFKINCWGKKSREAEDRFPIEVKQESFEELGDGWFRASAEFMVAETKLIRSFGIAAIEGDWKQLHIRNHHIACLSDSITELFYEEEIAFNKSEFREQEEESLEEYTELEKTEAELLQEKGKLESILLTFISNTREKRIKELKERIKNFEVLKRSFSQANHYWSNELRKAALKVTVYKHNDLDGEHLDFALGSHNTHALGTLQFAVSSIKVPNGLRLLLKNSKTGQTQIFEATPGSNLGSWNDYADLFYVTTDNQHSDIEKLKADQLASYNAEKQMTNFLLKDRKELSELEKYEGNENAIKKRLQRINNQLKKLDAALSKFKPQDLPNKSMSIVDQEARLPTSVALLHFVRPGSCLNVAETCEGNVQLSYFDQDGRMRQINYDAATDSLANDHFETWKQDGERPCVNLTQSSTLLLERPISLRDEWTISAWVSFPLEGGSAHQTTKDEYYAKSSYQKQRRYLTSSKAGLDGYIVVEYDLATNSEELGLCINDTFYGIGKAKHLRLPDGWHHLTLALRDGAAFFYLDGKEYGSYPSKEKLENVQKLESIAAADALKLANLYQKRDKNHSQNITSEDSIKSEKLIKKLEAKPEIKEEAVRIQSARAEARLKAPQKNPIAHLGVTPAEREGLLRKSFGKVAEVSFWDIALSSEEIEVNSKTLLSGNEPGLIAYYPMTEAKENTVYDHTGKGCNITADQLSWWRCTAPIGRVTEAAADSLVSVEYSTLLVHPRTGIRSSMMRRCLVYPSFDGIHVLAEKRVEELELLWIGNAQFAPTLLGFIEGAPPVPSENLTVESNYNGASSVMLSTSEDVAYSWARSDNSNLGSEADGFVGVAGGISAGIAIEKQVEKHRAGLKGSFKSNYEMLNSSTITSTSSIQSNDALSLRGTLEQKAKFPHLGKRFIPKNVGYALVVSALADVFISRLKRSRRMIGYQTIPVADIPPDFNTITFLINPAYTMAGSLDGMTGSRATSNRFFKHVPEMRAQYGSQYPASFFRLKEAYALKHQIEMQDKNRAAYFANFNARLVDGSSLDSEIGKGPAPTAIGPVLEVNKKEPLSDEEEAAAEKQAADQQKAKSQAGLEYQTEAAKNKNAQIREKIADLEKRSHAQEKLAEWQKKMENIQIRAGKRNIVNNYVWDADGGMRCEAQSFASTAEHMIGGSFSMLGKLGGENEFNVGDFAAELTAQVTGGLTQTMSKTQTNSKGFSLEVDVSGVESTGITNHDDYPINPGEKVDRYRFMSFYLEGSTQNFNDFFDYVVDPEWLASNDEEARALRQTQGKANKTWRVLHRVTYVERPALMGFGRDLRALEKTPAKPSEMEQLNQRIDDLQERLDDILKILNKG